MRTIVMLLLAAPLAGQAAGSAPADPDPSDLLRAKLAAPFLQHAAWTTDYDEARRAAKERGQLVFGYFTTAGY